GRPERAPAQRVRQEGVPAGDDDHRQEETEEVKAWRAVRLAGARIGKAPDSAMGAAGKLISRSGKREHGLPPRPSKTRTLRFRRARTKVRVRSIRCSAGRALSPRPRTPSPKSMRRNARVTRPPAQAA